MKLTRGSNSQIKGHALQEALWCLSISTLSEERSKLYNTQVLERWQNILPICHLILSSCLSCCCVQWFWLEYQKAKTICFLFLKYYPNECDFLSLIYYPFQDFLSILIQKRKNWSMLWRLRVQGKLHANVQFLSHSWHIIHGKSKTITIERFATMVCISRIHLFLL